MRVRDSSCSDNVRVLAHDCRVRGRHNVLGRRRTKEQGRARLPDRAPARRIPSGRYGVANNERSPYALRVSAVQCPGCGEMCEANTDLGDVEFDIAPVGDGRHVITARGPGAFGIDAAAGMQWSREAGFGDSGFDTVVLHECSGGGGGVREPRRPTPSSGAESAT